MRGDRDDEVSMKRPDVGHWIMATIILILSLFLWLTPYQYKKWEGVIVRIHRLTGKADMLDIEGWYPMRATTLEDEGLKPQDATMLKDLGLKLPKRKRP